MEWSPGQSRTRDRCDYRDFGLIELPEADEGGCGHLHRRGLVVREDRAEGDLCERFSWRWRRSRTRLTSGGSHSSRLPLPFREELPGTWCLAAQRPNMIQELKSGWFVSPRERAVPAQQSRLGRVGHKLWDPFYML